MPRAGHGVTVRVAAVVVSGAAFAASFPPYDLGWLAWLGLAPLFAAAAGQRPRAAAVLGYLWGLVGLGAVLWWLTAMGPVVWVLGTALAAVFPAAAVGGAAWAERAWPGRSAFLWTPVLWTAVEFVRSQGPMGFPWALVGESQHRFLAVAQVARIAGVWGVTFLVVLANVTLARALLRRAGWLAVSATAVAVGGAVWWGSAVVRAPVVAPAGPAALTAAVVQPDAPTYPGRASPDPARGLAVLRALTREAAARGASLVVWPETASPTDIPGDPRTLARIQEWVRADRTALIASSLEGGASNAAFAFSPAGALVGRYDKTRLVPFAEFGEHAGAGPGVLAIPGGRVGMAICFESTFPEIARRTVLDGAGILAVITNDAWFSRGPAAAEQHAAIAAFRAIEEGRYVLRAANSGTSEIIGPRGRVLARLPLGVRGVLVARVALRRSLTPYARYGDWLGWAAVAASAAALLPPALGRLGGIGSPAVARLLAVSVLPLFALLGASWAVRAVPLPPVTVAGAPVPLPVLALLAVTALLSLGRRPGVSDTTSLSRGRDAAIRRGASTRPRSLGFAAAGFAPALLLGLAVVAGAAWAASHAFAVEGDAIPLVTPAGGWWTGTAVQVAVVGLAFEWWLRGLVYEAMRACGGGRAAVAWPAVLGMLAGAPRGAEAMAWGLLAGVAFGLIRTRWPQIPALAVAHGAGNVLLGFLLSAW